MQFRERWTIEPRAKTGRCVRPLKGPLAAAARSAAGSRPPSSLAHYVPPLPGSLSPDAARREPHIGAVRRYGCRAKSNPGSDGHGSRRACGAHRSRRTTRPVTPSARSRRRDGGRSWRWYMAFRRGITCVGRSATWARRGSGSNLQRMYGDVARSLNKRLDKISPLYSRARGSAAEAFGAVMPWRRARCPCGRGADVMTLPTPPCGSFRPGRSFRQGAGCRTRPYPVGAERVPSEGGTRSLSRQIADAGHHAAPRGTSGGRM